MTGWFVSTTTPRRSSAAPRTCGTLQNVWYRLPSSKRRLPVLEAKAYSYAVVRVVPRVERDEFVNAGVILFSPELGFLGAEVGVHEDRILALWGGADLQTIRRHIEVIPQICAGDREAGEIAGLSQGERF